MKIYGIYHRQVRMKGQKSSWDIESCFAVGSTIPHLGLTRLPNGRKHKLHSRAICPGCDREVAVTRSGKFMFHGSVQNGYRSPHNWDRSVASYR